MFRFIKTQYLLGKGKDYVINAYKIGIITKLELEEIIGEEYVEEE